MTITPTAPTVLRTLHVVDLDNLTGGPTEHQCVADEAARRYRMAAGIRPRDLAVVGSDLRSAAVAAFAWHGARLVRTTGIDAVDHLLLDELAPSFVRGRVRRVVLGSGDGIFAERLSQLRSMGVRVQVIAPVRSVSRRIVSAADHVTLVEPPQACSDPSCVLPVGRVSLRLAA